jgi:hypothetical protein
MRNHIGRKEQHEMQSKDDSQSMPVRAVYLALFRGMKLTHVDDPSRIFLLQWIDWATHSTEVIDADTGETFVFPWNDLEFVGPIESNLPGFPSASKKSNKRRPGSK